MRLKLIAVSFNGEEAIKGYVDSVIAPSFKDRIRIQTGRAISNNIFRTAGIKPIVMLTEQYELNPIPYIECIVNPDYNDNGIELLDKAKNTYLKLFLKFNCTEKDFLIEVLND